MTKGRKAGRAPLLVVAVLGIGIALAPALFQMFDRAPQGKEMIDAFRPYMTDAQVEKFRGFLTEIGAARREAIESVDPAAAAGLGLDADAYGERTALLATFEEQWPAIDADMSDMLDRMDANVDNFASVDALPPFDLFPWFFVLPGVVIAGVAITALVLGRRGGRTGGFAIALVVLGLGLVAAPAIFQMFTRAPDGGRMIDDFRPLMTREKVTTIQGYFITIGNGEAQLRNVAVPASGLDTDQLPAATRFAEDWPRINREMAPMVGVMADNVEHFAAVDALPPFPLFPWFFVIPGLGVAVLALVAWRADRAPSTARRTTEPRVPAHAATTA